MKNDLFMSNPDTQTEWNSSMATLQRIDKYLQLCSTASLQKDFISWFKYLEILKREVIVKMNHTRKKMESSCEGFCPRCYCINVFDSLKKKISLYSRTPFADVLAAELNNELDNAEIYLREFMDKKGMLLKDGLSGIRKFQYG